MIGFENTLYRNYALKYHAAADHPETGHWIIRQSSEKHQFFPGYVNNDIKPRPTSGLNIPSPPQKFSGSALLGGVDIGIQAQTGGDNYLVVIAGKPAIDNAWIMTISSGGEKRPNIVWRTLSASGTIVAITPEISGATVPQPVKIGISYTHAKEKNPGPTHHLIIRCFTGEKPEAAENPLTTPYPWQEKRDPKTGRIFFEAEFPEFLDAKGHPKYYLPYMLLRFERLHIQFTPFRNDGERTFTGESTSLYHPKES